MQKKKKRSILDAWSDFRRRYNYGGNTMATTQKKVEEQRIKQVMNDEDSSSAVITIDAIILELKRLKDIIKSDPKIRSRERFNAAYKRICAGCKKTAKDNSKASNCSKLDDAVDAILAIDATK